ncbi:MAG: tail fiber protein [Pseudomonadota bacterium]
MSEPFLGEIRMVGFNFNPQGWALCNGQLMSIAQNSALFALLGVTFGGDGVTTFALPDYRGRGPVGMGNGVNLTPIVQGEVSGAENVTILQTQMPGHTHTAQFTGQNGAIGGTITASVDVGTSTAAVMVPPVAGATTYLSATTAKSGPSNVVFSGLYTGTAPDSTKAQLGGIAVQAGGLTATSAGTVSVGMTGNGLPVPLRNPFLGTNFIIATEGLFPSRP